MCVVHTFLWPLMSTCLNLQSLAHLKLALRVCAAFRGCYLDYREKSEVISVKHKERFESMKLQGDTSHDQNRVQQSGGAVLCPWPPRNAPVFVSLSSFMERCNDLFELVQTVQDFRFVSWERIEGGSECVHVCVCVCVCVRARACVL